MARSSFLLVLCWLAMGCGGRKGEYQASGPPSVKFEVRSASIQPVEGWELVSNLDQPGEQLYLSPKTAVSNVDVARTGVKKTSSPNEHWQVEVWLTDDGKGKLAKLTKELTDPSPEHNSPKRAAILVDGKVVAAAVVLAEITVGFVQISSRTYSEAEARKVAKGIVGP